MVGITVLGGSSSSSSASSGGNAAIPFHLRAILGLGGLGGASPLFGAAGAGAAGGGAAGAGSAGPPGELVMTPLQFFQDHYPESVFECIRTAPVQYANDAKSLWSELTRMADQSRTGTYLQSTAISGQQLPGHWRYIPHLGAPAHVYLYISTSLTPQ